MILVYYHAEEDQAYWIHIQEYLRAIPGLNLAQIGKTYTVYFNRDQVVNDAAIDHIVQ